MTKNGPRASFDQPKFRAKIDTTEQINLELKKIYRLQRNKQITLAEAKSLRESLLALRNGMPDPVEQPKPVVSTLTLVSIDEGCQFVCGVLMPYAMATATRVAHNAGAESWKAYLQEVEGKLTKVAFESLSSVSPLERAKLVQDEAPRLSLVPRVVPEVPEKDYFDASEEAQLKAALADITHAEFLSMTVAEVMAKAGISDRGPDDAA